MAQVPGLRERFLALAAGKMRTRYVPSTRYGRKAYNPVADVQLAEAGQARWTPMDYAAASREGYGRNPYVYAAIREVSTTFAGIRWQVWADATKKSELLDHPLKKLLDRPNVLQGHSTFFEEWMGHRLIDGNTFVLATGTTPGQPLELYCLRPDRVAVILGTPANPIAGYQYTVGERKQMFPADRIRHFKVFNPLDPFRGMSPMSAAAMSIDQSNASKAWNVGLLQHGATPSGVITTQFMLSPEQDQRLREDIDDKYAGFMNAGRPILLEGGATWTSAGLSPTEMSWLEGQKLSAREIAIVYNIDPALIGDSANKTYSNQKESRLALYQENIMPLCDMLREELNAWLVPMFGDPRLYCDYDKSDIEALQADADALSTRVTAQFTAGYIKVNEARVKTGYDEDPGDWGDKYVWELPARSPTGAEGAMALNEAQIEATKNPPQPKLPEGAQPAQLPSGNTGQGVGESGDTTVPGNTVTGAGTGKGGTDAVKRVLPFARGPHATRKYG